MEPKWASCPWFPKGLLNRSFYYHLQIWYHCLLDNFSDSTVSQHDENIMINGYSLLRADRTSSSKRGGVCLYIKEHLPLIRRNDLWILLECELQNFPSNLDFLLSNINDNYWTCSIPTGGFNIKCSKWCNDDKSNSAGIELDNITNSVAYSQWINEPKHFVNKTSFALI